MLKLRSEGGRCHKSGVKHVQRLCEWKGKNISVNATERLREKVAHDKAGDGSKGQITQGPEAVLRVALDPQCNLGDIGGFKERNHMAQSSTLVTLKTTWRRKESWGGRMGTRDQFSS